MTRKFDKEIDRRNDKVGAWSDPVSSFDFQESAPLKARDEAYRAWRTTDGKKAPEYLLKSIEYRYDLSNGELIPKARIGDGPMLPPDRFAMHYRMIPCIAPGKPLELT